MKWMSLDVNAFLLKYELKPTTERERKREKKEGGKGKKGKKKRKRTEKMRKTGT